MVLNRLRLLLCSIQLLLLVALVQGCGDSSVPGTTTDTGTVAPSTEVSFSNGAIITVVKTTGTSYSINGQGVSDTQGIQLTLTYDKAMVSNPVVTVGDMLNGAMFVANINNPGVVRLVGLLPAGVAPTSGSIATITFSQPADATLRLTYIKMINPQGVTTGIPVN